MVTGPVGLIVIHGIGQQKPGLLRDRMGRHLADDASSLESAESGAVRLASIDGIPVAICEANWSAQSSPDNLPVVRLGLDLVRSFVDMLRTTALEPPIVGGAIRARGVVWLNLAALAALAVLGVLVIGAWLEFDACKNLVGIILESLERAESRLGSDQTPPPWGLVVATLAFWAYLAVVWSGSDSMVALKSRPGLLPGLVRVVVIACVPLLTLLAIEWTVIFIAAAAIGTALSVVLSSLFWLIVQSARGVSRCLLLVRVPFMSKWLNRVVWVMLVLPLHSFMQATKAVTNLIGIVLFDHGGARKAAASAWMPGVYVSFLAILVLCEVLVGPALMPIALDDPSVGWGDRAIITGALMLIYLPLLRLCLPAIDLLLDISNYQLASQGERMVYARVIDRALEELDAVQCRSVHVLAHSLGSVIVYDWLRRQGRESRIEVLHTIGSPLNKFWYLDHSRRERKADEEKALPVSAWYNYWAWSDPVSGGLQRYGPIVKSLRLRRLGVPIWSHVAYWSDPTVKEGIRRSIVQTSR